MSDRHRKTDYTGAFKKAATSKPAKMTGMIAGGLIAAYYGLATITTGMVVLLGGDNMPEDFEQQLDNKAYVHKVADNECHFVDTTLKNRMTFLEYPSGYLSGTFRLFTPFVETDRVYHDLGSMPVLSDAPCDVLKEDKIVTKGEAFELIDQWKRDLMNGEKARQALESMESGKGIFGSVYVRQSTPKP